MYEEQELTMQVFSEPDIVTNEPEINVSGEFIRVYFKTTLLHVVINDIECSSL